jgi:uncharacterized protein (TIGR02246 family)
MVGMQVTAMHLLLLTRKDTNKYLHSIKCFLTNLSKVAVLSENSIMRFVTEDVAVEIAVGRTVMTGQCDIDPDRKSSHTLVAVKRNLKWHFTAFHNSRA